MIQIKKTTVKRTKRTDAIIYLRHTYDGDITESPSVYNKAFADVLRNLADAVEGVKNAWADPEAVVWMHKKGVITAEVSLSPMETKL